MKPVLGAFKRLDELRANWLKGQSVGSGKKQKAFNLLSCFFHGLTVKTEKCYV